VTEKIRSVFRIVEFATGWHGPVNTNERFFYIFDASMMYAPTFPESHFRVPATGIFVFFFPAKYGVLSNKQLGRQIEARKQRQYELQP
jgi:hypothetical protein